MSPFALMETAQEHFGADAWVGRQQAFAVIAMKFPAAQAAALKEIKDSPAYASRSRVLAWSICANGRAGSKTRGHGYH